MMDSSSSSSSSEEDASVVVAVAKRARAIDWHVNLGYHCGFGFDLIRPCNRVVLGKASGEQLLKMFRMVSEERFD